MLDHISRQLNIYLASTIKTGEFYNSRLFYGESFALLLLAETGLLSIDLRDSLIDKYRQSDKQDPEYHWEFTNFALLKYREVTGDKSLDEDLFPLRFKGTKSTNWTLLRFVTTIMSQPNNSSATSGAIQALKHRQDESGLIWDGKYDRSFQYHCFSLFLCHELYQYTNNEFFLSRFRQGLRFIRYFILANGDTLYLGRGQEQSFGYGSLLNTLAQGLHSTDEPGITDDINRVVSLIAHYQRTDGSFPLVMNDTEKNSAPLGQSSNQLPGWYSYNNYFDYLPFFAHMLWQSAQLINQSTPSKTRSGSTNFRNKYLIKTVQPNYEAVIARSDGFWSNDMPMPYVVYKKKTLFPCYGGEQYFSGIHRITGLPLPCHTQRRFSFRWRRFFISWLSKNTYWLLSPFGLVRRVFTFLDDRIIVRTSIYSWLRWYHNYLFIRGISQVNSRTLCDPYFTIEASRDLQPAVSEFSASGELSAYVAEGANCQITIRFHSPDPNPCPT